MFVTLFWAIALVTDAGKKDKPRLFLGLFMFVASVLYASHAAYFSLNYKIYSFLDPVYTLTSLSVFPLFYLYIKGIAKDGTINAKGLWVLTPAIFFTVATVITFAIMSPEELSAYLHKVIYKESGQFPFSLTAEIQIVIFKLSRVVFVLQLIPSVYYSSISGYKSLTAIATGRPAPMEAKALSRSSESGCVALKFRANHILYIPLSRERILLSATVF